ncbi:hypothetical protein HNP46_000073 [Pseudomonas nitritireducens]|uniref:Uncharacterized protein n=1 Tax=Pseudomonas nitroreducens TaxID=46680 RepID=A0A7W7NZJ1_PSENT|nr:hypothetical protein [Pseudomonas nitritireducens]MBB4861262.1 hypothetical protein [Pseudomonas nitritireducens]
MDWKELHSFHIVHRGEYDLLFEMILPDYGVDGLLVRQQPNDIQVIMSEIVRRWIEEGHAEFLTYVAQGLRLKKALISTSRAISRRLSGTLAKISERQCLGALVDHDAQAFTAYVTNLWEGYRNTQTFTDLVESVMEAPGRLDELRKAKVTRYQAMRLHECLPCDWLLDRMGLAYQTRAMANVMGL